MATKEEIQALILSKIPDNQTGQITEADLRDSFDAVLDEIYEEDSELKALIDAFANGEGKTYTSLAAAMAVDPLPSDNTPFRVDGDSTPANDGNYIYNSGEGGGYTYLSELIKPSEVLDPDSITEFASGKAVADYAGKNLFEDPYLQNLKDLTANGSITAFANTAAFKLTDPDTYGARKIDIDYAGNSEARIYFDLTSLGIVPGDSLRVSYNYYATAPDDGDNRLDLLFQDASGSDIGSRITGTKVDNLISGQTTEIATVPASALTVVVYLVKSNTVNSLKFDGFIITAGEDIQLPRKKSISGSVNAPQLVADVNKATIDRNHIIGENLYPNEIFSLVRGADDTITPSGLDGIDEKNIWVKNSFSYKFASEATSGALGKDAKWEFSPSLEVPIGKRFGAWIYVAEPDKVTQGGLSRIDLLIKDELDNTLNERSIRFTDLKKGWNICMEEASVLEQGGYISRVRLLLYTESSTEISVGHVFIEHGGKAQMMIINDAGRKSFMDYAYDDLKAINMPVTWALQPGRFSDTLPADFLSEAEILTLAEDANSAFSFHSWAGESSATATNQEIRKYTLMCLRWLRRNGLIDRFAWRAAWLQNNAPNAAAIKDLVVAYRTGEVATSGNPRVFPFDTPFGFGTGILHGLDDSAMDDLFDILKTTRQSFNGYTHAITPAGGSSDMSEAQWDYFLAHLQTGVSEGWLEGVTMDTLCNGNPLNLSYKTHPDFIRATSE